MDPVQIAGDIWKQHGIYGLGWILFLFMLWKYLSLSKELLKAYKENTEVITKLAERINAR